MVELRRELTIPEILRSFPPAAVERVMVAPTDQERLSSLKEISEQVKTIQQRDIGNAHNHTLESYSRINNSSELALLARMAGLRYVGISNFNTTAGTEEFLQACNILGIAPIRGVEIMCSSNFLKQQNVRINDPNNPGRIYSVGYGLAFREEEVPDVQAVLNCINSALQERIRQILAKLNDYLKRRSFNFSITLTDFKHLTGSKGIIRERTISELLQLMLWNLSKDPRPLLKQLIGSDTTNIDIENLTEVHNLIRSRLLKKGGGAFVDEALFPTAFISVSTAARIVHLLGGLFFYPILGTEKTELELDHNQLLAFLKDNGYVGCELITVRNTVKQVERYAKLVADNGFLLTLGTENNTFAEPVMVPTCINGPVPRWIVGYANNSCFKILGHQMQAMKGEMGLVDNFGQIVEERQKLLEEIGKDLVYNT